MYEKTTDCNTALGQDSVLSGGSDIRKRPKGITVVAVIALISGFLQFTGIFLLRPETSLLLGMRVPFVVFVTVSLARVGLRLYSGIGLLKIRKIAFQIYIGLSVFDIMDLLGYCIGMAFSTRYHFSGPARTLFDFGSVISTLIGLAIPVSLLLYIVKKRDYFVN